MKLLYFIGFVILIIWQIGRGGAGLRLERQDGETV